MTGAAAHAARALEVSGVDAKAVLKKPIELYADTRRGKVTVNGHAPVYLEQAEIRDTSRESERQVLTPAEADRLLDAIPPVGEAAGE